MRVMTKDAPQTRIAKSALPETKMGGEALSLEVVSVTSEMVSVG